MLTVITHTVNSGIVLFLRVYINIHSHQITGQNNQPVLYNYIMGRSPAGQLPQYFSAGIHPWYIPENPFVLLQQLRNMLQQPGMLAVGECGLDKLCVTHWEKQVQVFEAQIQLVLQHKKPLIIHCVKAFNEVIKVLDDNGIVNSEIPVIFHGFNKSVQLAQTLINKGYYLSFGAAVLKKNISSYLPLLPLNRIFLETDDASLTISEIYQIVSNILNITLEQLSLQLQQNCTTVFNIKL